MPESLGDAAQTRRIVEPAAQAAAEIAIAKFAASHPELAVPKAEIPPPLKWASAIIAGLLLLASGGMATWLVTTVNEMQVTLARMDERQLGGDTAQKSRDDDQDRRIGRLEQYHEGGG